MSDPEIQPIPSGKLTWLLKIAIEIVDLPIKNGDVPSFFVCLPEGKSSLAGSSSPEALQATNEVQSDGHHGFGRSQLEDLLMA